jgi:hypothetical protein
MNRYLLLFDRYGLVFVGRPLWLDDRSVFCICCWPLPAQSFSGSGLLGLATIFFSQIWDFPFRHLLDFQGQGGGIQLCLHTVYAPVLIWPAALIALRYPMRCLLLARIHGHACGFHRKDLAFKSLQLPFSYPWTRLFNTRRWFVSKNRSFADTCLPNNFLETAYMSQYKRQCYYKILPLLVTNVLMRRNTKHTLDFKLKLKKLF